ncbi:hypothetical protein H920_05325 [Fukomys damarensis]|uniref:Uncharacterized protein n=1 Tax=Fukomys damarensis TaxID=885580 RepID=A0A091DPY7_FUKDA|nr:hypothetical protein H920_05325 [Fukomys damarensis]
MKSPVPLTTERHGGHAVSTGGVTTNKHQVKRATQKLCDTDMAENIKATMTAKLQTLTKEHVRNGFRKCMDAARQLCAPCTLLRATEQPQGPIQASLSLCGMRNARARHGKRNSWFLSAGIHCTAIADPTQEGLQDLVRTSWARL